MYNMIWANILIGIFEHLRVRWRARLRQIINEPTGRRRDKRARIRWNVRIDLHRQFVGPKVGFQVGGQVGRWSAGGERRAAMASKVSVGCLISGLDAAGEHAELRRGPSGLRGRKRKDSQ